MNAFSEKVPDSKKIAELERLAKKCRGDILRMTTVAKSGHPGGSMSSIDIYLTLWSFADICLRKIKDPGRDRIVVSHGHTSPGVYSVLGNLGFFDLQTAIASFRLAGSIFEGHVEREVPGVEWGTGNLGQGLSAGCGMALAARLTGSDFRVYVIMGDGEQQKGQISEARRFAAKYGLRNLTVVIDCNHLQISGNTAEVMPQRLIDEYKADGFETIEIDGHSFRDIYRGFHEAGKARAPVMILAHTVMGKMVSFMENQHQYHGKPLTEEEFSRAIAELGQENDLNLFQKKREQLLLKRHQNTFTNQPCPVISAEPRVYSEKTDNRSAYGNALLDIAAANLRNGVLPMAVLDCDLAGSVKTDEFMKKYPANFFQAGIQEHHAATMAGALSTQGILTFWSDFGVFGVDETYNQARLNDINQSELKLCCTHCGLDVGEDGKTHHCIDYVGLFRNLPGFKVVVPADPNQTDRVIKEIAVSKGNFLAVMGRSKLEILKREDGTVQFPEKYRFKYGETVALREEKGVQVSIFAVGQLAGVCLKAWSMLKKEGISVNVFSVSCPLSIDESVLERTADNSWWITVEDHLNQSGFGSTLARYMAAKGVKTRLLCLGPENYSVSGDSGDLYRMEGLDAIGISGKIKSLLC
ncbi:MAG: transketolase [Candidatus Wallbacteria bacterium]|nr:transketolase [Candidatus Wallbacteria bacterium]